MFKFNTLSRALLSVGLIGILASPSAYAYQDVKPAVPQVTNVVNVAQQAHPLTAAQIDTLVSNAMKTFNVPGVAVAVVKDDKVVHMKAYGVRSIQTKEPVDEHTLFGIASNSKQFTAAALSMLVEEKKLKWDDKVVKYIPEFKLYNDYVTQETTVIDLLTHRTGLGLGAGDLMYFPDGTHLKIADVIKGVQYLKPAGGFRDSYNYNNAMYIIAGEIITRITGQSWEDFIETRFLKPLQMKDSVSSFHRIQNNANVIDAHPPLDFSQQLTTVKPNPNDAWGAAAGIYASAHDVSIWVRTLLKKGIYATNAKGEPVSLLSEESLRNLWHPRVNLSVPTKNNPYNTHFSAYALGMQVSDVKGYKQVSHSGGLLGNVTNITMIPELQLGIIVLTNQEQGAAFTAISNQIKDSYLGVQGIDRVQEANAIVEKREAAHVETMRKIEAEAERTTPSQEQYQQTAGLYVDNWLGDAIVSYDKRVNKLMLSIVRSPELKGELIAYKGDTWIVKWDKRYLNADAFVKFSRNEKKQVQGFTMAVLSSATDFSFDFHDLDFQKVNNHPPRQDELKINKK